MSWKGGTIRPGRRDGSSSAIMKGPHPEEGKELEPIARLSISPTPASATPDGKAPKARKYNIRLSARSPPHSEPVNGRPGSRRATNTHSVTSGELDYSTYFLPCFIFLSIQATML